jgi:hypothetical protein
LLIVDFGFLNEEEGVEGADVESISSKSTINNQQSSIINRKSNLQTA